MSESSSSIHYLPRLLLFFQSRRIVRINCRDKSRRFDFLLDSTAVEAETEAVQQGVDHRFHDVCPMLNLRNEIYSRPIYPSNYERNYAFCRDIL